jgi:probable HAF family extracellular repeat protein
MNDLGTLGGDTSFAYDVGGLFACGEAATSDGARHAFVTTGNTLTDLGTLGGTYSAAINCSGTIVGESSVSDDSATHAVLWNSQLAITDLGTLGGTESRALRPGDGGGEILGESRTVDGDLHPVRWWSGHIADFAQALGASSQIELAVPVRGDLTKKVISGTACPGAPVHAYLVSVPGPFDSIPPRAIVDGVIENIEASQDVTHFAFTVNDVTASMGSRTDFRVCQRQPCVAGNVVSLAQNQFVTEDSFGSATVLGNQYDSLAMPQVRYAISAGSFTIPTSGEQSITVSMPFSYSGFVRGAFESAGMYDPLFAVSLSGAGTVTFELFSCDTCILPDGRRLYSETKLQYVFEPPSESVLNADSGMSEVEWLQSRARVEGAVGYLSTDRSR